jgi:hypothetical protein
MVGIRTAREKRLDGECSHTNDHIWFRICGSDPNTSIRREQRHGTSFHSAGHRTSQQYHSCFVVLRTTPQDARMCLMGWEHEESAQLPMHTLHNTAYCTYTRFWSAGTNCFSNLGLSIHTHTHSFLSTSLQKQRPA